MRASALIVAAGRGERMVSETGDKTPKQYRTIGGAPVLRWTLAAFLSHPGITRVVTVINPSHRELYEEAVAGLEGRLTWVAGGATRQNSVRAGLRALDVVSSRQVLIHDAVRPFASEKLINGVMRELENAKAVLPVMPPVETLKRVANGVVTETLERVGLVAAQTPQGFHLTDILDAHNRAAETGRHEFSDDAAVAEWAGLSVRVMQGEAGNMKITTAEDLAAADRRLTMEQISASGDVRTGHGFDVHTVGPGDHMMLCGVRVDANQGLSGHSDADVGLHAITDAILGAIGEGDIGQHFPAADPQWKGASSGHFLAFAAKRVAARGGSVAHVDVTLVCETPRISPYRSAMRESVARILGIEKGRVSVKATTTEGLGFTGRGEGIAAQATATIRLPVAK
jgi:2-C-methyl-D-erythritol 4-phosphate cytidylyltransferase / 2-C-methyl-D-erythritol 2,4-cyclodiphosphate synthase